MFKETLIQNSPFKGQAIDVNTNKVVDISDFVGVFDILEEIDDKNVIKWKPIEVTRCNNLVRSFLVKDDNTPILLREYSESECGIGAGCWLSSIAMLSWLSDHPQSYANKRILEVGCGVALNSLYLAHTHQDHTKPQSNTTTSITASDYMNTIGCVFDENIALNNIKEGQAEYKILDWQQCCSSTYNPLDTIGTYDFIIATDCIYKSTAPMFFNVIKHHLAPNGKLLLINPMETSRPGIDQLIYKMAEMGEVRVSHIAIQLNKKYTKPLLFVEFTA